MSRFAFMARHPKRSLGVLALLLAAMAVTVGSGANFTAQSANPTNVFTAGTLTMSNSPGNGTAVFTAAQGLWKPGVTRPGTVDIQNTGSIAGDFVLNVANLTNTPAAPGLMNRMTIKVDDCGLWTNGNTTPPGCVAVTTVYPTGAPLALSNVALGTFAPGDKHRYTITMSWPNGTPAQDNPLQGASGQFDLVWTAS